MSGIQDRERCRRESEDDIEAFRKRIVQQRMLEIDDRKLLTLRVPKELERIATTLYKLYEKYTKLLE